MIGFTIKPGPGISAAKAAFLDRSAISRAVDRGRRRALARSGGLVRTIARRSMRRRPGRSRPGQPPHAHSGELRDLLFFSYDRSSDSVVVGPAAFARRTGAPATLEFGGRTKKPVWWRGVQKYIRVRPRPTMAPALKKSQPQLAGFWKDQIR